jgi:hypothetical protein
MSRLLTNSEEDRKKNLARNEYNNDDPYRTSHSRAKSDGDEHGKGELDGSVGSKTDIIVREESLARNLYNKEKTYGQHNA